MSNLSDFLGGGGGGGGTGEVFAVVKSGTFTFPYDGKVKIYCIGGGGGGGRGAINNRSLGSGGAAGGTAVKVLDVTANDSIICTIGAGGAGATGTPGSGSSGGQSAVNSNTLAIALTANGGSGGVGANISNGGTFSNVSGAGTGSGGDYNFTGGLGGTISLSTGGGANSNQGYYATGGGATGINQNGISGGNINANNQQVTFTAGGSVYGTPRNISINSSNSYGYVGRAAPGTGDAPAYSNANDRFLTNTNPPTAASYRAFSGIDTEPGNSAQVASALRGEGVSGGYDLIQARWIDGGPGAGSAHAGANENPNAGIFGGGGSTRGNATLGSNGGVGGGGGGGVARTFATSTIPTQSGSGGRGMIIIQYV